ncbi:MAG: AI-2E family transporter [Alloprevotella sp.]|nr:AI-2E family transporter [Alloprevotella sp.]MBR1652498.1 AI-2E family transporter [Alloprevotella sp.]
MFSKEINFDRFVRGLLFLLAIVGVYLVLDYLSSVLMPFFVAWIAAYLLYPIVRFLEVKCRLRNRILCIFLTLLLVGSAVAAVAYVIVPPFVEEMSHVKEVATRFVNNQSNYRGVVPEQLEQMVRENLSPEKIEGYLKEKDVQKSLQTIVGHVADVVMGAAGAIIEFIASLMGILYFFFLLKDYEKYSEGWLQYVPRRRRPMVQMLVSDITRGMNGYFRGQALVALSNCVMFSLGFLIIGFPMPIALGCFIGLISFIPYVQVVGILPAALLALLRAADTGQNFWLLIGGVILVYLVVQILQDTIVTPLVMGNITGLSPAIILLALSVWGYMLGIIGLIIALPITTLMISYYKRFIIGEEAQET